MSYLYPYPTVTEYASATELQNLQLELLNALSDIALLKSQMETKASATNLSAAIARIVALESEPDFDPTSLQTSISLLQLRVTDLEKNPWFVESIAAPDNTRSDWRLWLQNQEQANRERKVCLSAKIPSLESSLELICHTILPPVPTHDNAVNNGNGTFTNVLAAGVTFTYNPTPAANGYTYNNLSWTPAGIVSNVRFEAIAANGSSLGNAATSPSEAMVHDISNFYAYAGAVVIKLIVAFRDGRAAVEYSYPII